MKVSWNELGLKAIRAGTLSYGTALAFNASNAALIGVTYAVSSAISRLADRVEWVRRNEAAHVLWEGIGSTLVAYGAVTLLTGSFVIPSVFWAFELLVLFLNADQNIGRSGWGISVVQSARDAEARHAIAGNKRFPGSVFVDNDE